MSTTPEDFDKLQKLLKIKQREVPPPNFFNQFSSSVLHGIEHKDQNPPAPVPWQRRFVALLNSNPFAAGMFAASVCGLLIAGVAWSQYRPKSEYSMTPTSPTTVTTVAAPSETAKGVDSLSPTVNL